jgi:two-component system LytT family response regulator
MGQITKIRTIIIDDEMKARDVLKRLIAVYCPEIEVIGEGNSIESGMDVITKLKPDLVFLDIHLDTQNSFDLLSKIDCSTFDIIFTSGHSSYGVNAFKVNAIDYILKPVDSDDLISAVERVVKKRELESRSNEGTVSIPVHINDLVEYINSNQICALEADNNYTQIFTLESKKYLASKTLSDIEELLKETNQFIRIHRSICVNTRFISSYSKTEPFEITMANGNVYEISRRKKGEVLATLKGMEISTF